MTRRLAAALVGFTAVVLLVSVLPLGLATAARDRRDYRTGTADLARSLATLADEAFDSRTGRLTSERLFAALGRDTGAVVVDARGHQLVRAGLGFLYPRALVRRALSGGSASGTTSGRDSSPVAAAAVLEGETVRGAVVVMRSDEPLEARLTRLWVGLGAVCAISLVLAAGLAMATARWVSRPIRRLEQTAQGWADGRLTERAEVKGGPPEIRQLAATFNAMAGRLEALLFGSRAVVADVSHQLRTPLAAVRLRLELMRGEIAASEEEDLTAALAEIDRLSRLVDGLLAVARAENASTAPEPVDVGRLMAERRQAWQPVAEERGVRIEVDVDGHVPPAAATPGHLEQVVDNLLANAVEALPAGGHVVLRSAVSDGRVELHVVDDGPGIPSGVRAHVFRRFVTGDKTQGTGLGLAIVHRLVTSDGGDVYIRETAGGGTTVVVSLPAARTATPALR